MSSLVHRKLIFSLLSFHHQGMEDSHNNLMFKSLEEKLDFFKMFFIHHFKGSKTILQGANMSNKNKLWWIKRNTDAHPAE